MVRYLTISKFAAESGYTEDAVRNKIQRGLWLENVVWVTAPDNRLLIDVEGYHAWVERQVASDLGRRRASRSTSTTGARGAASA